MGSSNEIDAGGDDTSTERRLSDDDLLGELQRVAGDLDKTPSLREMAAHGEYAPSTYQSRFGSWNDAVVEAGLPPNSRRQPEYADEELLDHLRDLADDLDRTPCKKDMREEGSHSPTTYADRFGSWRDAVDAAGLSPPQRGTAVSCDELLAELESLASSLGRAPTSTEMDESGAFSSSTYHRHFGSWTAAVEAADVPDGSSTTRRLSDEDLLGEVRRLAAVLHRPPTTTEMDEFGEYSPSTYRRRFGSWADALAAAGLDPDERHRGSATGKIGERALLDDLRSLADDLGRSPTAEDVQERGEHSPATYLDRYETWNAALEAAGLDTRRSRRDGIGDRELIVELRRLAASLGRLPQRTEMEEQGPFSGMTYYSRFGSWQDALAASGFVTSPGSDDPLVQGFCNVCCRSLTQSVSRIREDGKLYCGSDCEAVGRQDVVEFEADVLGRATRKGIVLGRFAYLLDQADTLVPDVLLCLRYAMDIEESGFDSAVRDGCEIRARGGRVDVTAERGPESFRVATGTLAELAGRVEETAHREDEAPSPTWGVDDGVERNTAGEG
ncbi:homing endonuclease associated repeat-containing protein [Halomicrococcus gelatinilyticus]|uniref:homing endonuclease associated repeat-containing protein n=1 Tax=Halomicrococcus gelatinilyticus TaxID=1702103 RepID=UPI002E0E1159